MACSVFFTLFISDLDENVFFEKKLRLFFAQPIISLLGCEDDADINLNLLAKSRHKERGAMSNIFST